MTTKPLIIFIHGAWHPPATYAGFIRKLEAAGFEVVTPTNVTVSGVPGSTWKDDVEVIHKAALPLFDQGREAIMLTHSYGGIPGTHALQGQQVGERAREGKRGGFKAVLYTVSFLIPKGLDLCTMIGGKYLDCMESAPNYQGVCHQILLP
jgi:hypothetical protein